MSKRKEIHIRLRSAEVQEARELVLSGNAFDLVAKAYGVSPEKLSGRQFDEYVYALGLEALTKGVKEAILEARNKGLSEVVIGQDVRPIDRAELAKHMRSKGYDGFADALEREEGTGAPN